MGLMTMEAMPSPLNSLAPNLCQLLPPLVDFRMPAP